MVINVPVFVSRMCDPAQLSLPVEFWLLFKGYFDVAVPIPSVPEAQLEQASLSKSFSSSTHWASMCVSVFSLHLICYWSFPLDPFRRVSRLHAYLLRPLAPHRYLGHFSRISHLLRRHLESWTVQRVRTSASPAANIRVARVPGLRRQKTFARSRPLSYRLVLLQER